ncbi:MAG: hypothetical protein P8078_02105 [bacterium]
MKKNNIKSTILLLLSGVISISILISSQCKFEDPAAPNWDVNFTLPLLAKSYSMEDLAKDVKEINIKDDTVWVNIEEDFGSEKVGDKLRVDGTSKTTTIPGGGSIRDSVSIPGDNIILESAVIKSGQLDELTFDNKGSSPVDVHFEIKDLSKDGGVFTIETHLGANDDKSFHNEYKLDGYVLSPQVYNKENYVRFEGSLTGGSGNVDITLELSDLVFSSVTGILDSVEIEIDSLEADFEIPEEFKDFAVEQANLKIAFNSTIAFPFFIDIFIDAVESRRALPDPIHITQFVEPSGYGADTVNIGDIADFINSQPTNIKIYGNAFIGEGESSHSITENDSISGTVLFNAPLTVSIPSLASKMEPDTLTLDEDTQDFFRDNLIRAEFNAEVENGLPIGTNVSIVFSSTSSDTLMYENGNYDLKFDLNLRKAPTSNTDPAVVTGTRHSTLNITLEEEEISLFANNDTLFVGFLFEFLGPNNLTQFQPQDSLQIEAWISALINTTIPEDEDE